MREAPNQRGIWSACCTIGRTVLFRVNTGIGWVRGAAGQIRHLPDGSVVIPGGRPVTLGFGLANNTPVNGAGDLCGWHAMVITPDMVGCVVAVFTSVECKATSGGRVTGDQRNWRSQLVRDGGIATIARTPEEAQAAIRDFRPPRPEDSQNRRPN